MRSQPRPWASLFNKLRIVLKKRNAPSNNRQQRKLRFEYCEDRCMLTTFTVNVDYDTDSWIDTDSEVTLREAVERADQDVVADIINFDSSLDDGTITLGIDSLGNNLNFTSNQGDLTVTKSVTIDASMLASGLTVDASAGNGSRVFFFRKDFALTDEQTHFTLDGLTITGGDKSIGGGVRFNGVSYGSDGYTKLTIQNTIITGNSGSTGGGVYIRSEHFYEGNSDPSIFIKDSTISGNVAENGDGGGLFLYTSGVTSEISGTAISGNVTLDGEGGGAYFEIRHGATFANPVDGNTGKLTISNSVISGNQAQDDTSSGFNADGGGFFALLEGNQINSIGAIFVLVQREMDFRW